MDQNPRKERSMSNDQAGNAADPARSRLLSGPIVPTLLRLALPTLVVMVVQTLVGVVQTIFVSHLGTAALAGLTLVFPVLMLMQMMSNGGLRSGGFFSVARGGGAGRGGGGPARVVSAPV